MRNIWHIAAMMDLLRMARIGRKVRKAAAGIVAQERFADYSPTDIVDWSTELQGDFEIIVSRRSA